MCVLWIVVCPFFPNCHCVVCPSSFGHCVVCPSSFGHCVVCPSSFGHCVVCPSSFGHCVVCPSIYDIVSERRISRNSRDDMTFDNMGNTNPTKTSKKWWRTQVLRKGRQFPASHVVPVKLLPPRSRGYLSKYLVSHLRILWVFVLSYNLLF
jgi:hypothetical protein